MTKKRRSKARRVSRKKHNQDSDLTLTLGLGILFALVVAFFSISKGLDHKVAPQRMAAKNIITLTQPRFAKTNSHTDLAVTMVNSQPKASIGGYVYAIANMRAADGKDVTVAIPEGIQLSDRGYARNPTSGIRYKFTRQVDKTFAIKQATADNNAQIVKVKVVAVDVQGNIVGEHSFPADGAAH